MTDTKFTSNDLGYFTNNNFLDHNLYVGYRYTEPKGWYNRLFFNANASLSRLYAPIGNLESKFQQANVQVNINAQTKKLHWLGLYLNYRPAQNDFYEPRQTGLMFRRGNSVAFGGWVETNSAKKYSVSLEAFERVFVDFYNLNGLDLFVSQQYRFNSKFSIRHSVNLQPRPRGLGYTSMDEIGSPVFALRDVKTVDNTLFLKYNFTNKMGLTFRARHYASVVHNKEYFSLNDNGSLKPKPGFEGTNRNVNFFNVDMVYTWQFAPGSFLNVVWKNATYHNTDLIDVHYFQNLSHTLQANQNNNLSLKVIYFLDYQQVRNRLQQQPGGVRTDFVVVFCPRLVS